VIDDHCRNGKRSQSVDISTVRNAVLLRDFFGESAKERYAPWATALGGIEPEFI
jgi:hypothetical protein